MVIENRWFWRFVFLERTRLGLLTRLAVMTFLCEIRARTSHRNNDTVRWHRISKYLTLTVWCASWSVEGFFFSLLWDLKGVILSQQVFYFRFAVWVCSGRLWRLSSTPRCSSSCCSACPSSPPKGELQPPASVSCYVIQRSKLFDESGKIRDR